MKLLKQAGTLVFSMIISVAFLTTSCAEATYVYQNGTTYNDYEVATNYRIKSATPKRKINSSKAPNWKRYNQENKYKRYN